VSTAIAIRLYLLSLIAGAIMLKRQQNGEMKLRDIFESLVIAAVYIALIGLFTLIGTGVLYAKS
jgi:hypothetical protein